MTDAPEFTLFFDSACPLCRREVAWLQRRNRAGRLCTVDIADPGFDALSHGLDPDRVHAELHGRLADGTHTVGMESMRRAWTAVGLGYLLAPTRWPVLRGLADLAYRLFARYRVPLGRLLGRRCDPEGSCSVRGTPSQRGPRGDAE